jgi:NADH dehydrogenase FAD-containing subunit
LPSYAVYSRDNFFVMTPLLFEASSGILDPRHAVASIRTYLKKTNFLQAEIERIDLDARKVRVRVDGSHDAHELAYDQLVLALGGTTNTRLVPGAADVLTFKTMGDAIFVRNHCIQRFERADVETDMARKRAMLTFVVVGGGFVGTELVGELSEFLPNVSRAYKNVSASEIRLLVLQAAPRIAMEFEEKMEHAVQAFEVVGVAILALGSAVALVGAAVAALRGQHREAYEKARQNIGRAILLGLEVLIIADIVETITIDPTLESAAALALIVVVRTFLSFSLEIELDGVVPWRKKAHPSTGDD